VLHERLPETHLADGSELVQRAVAAPVVDGAARFQPVDADLLEGEVEHHLRAFDEHSVAPERRAEREAPLGGSEALLQRTNLNDADRFGHPLRHDAEADELAGRALPVRPLDEALVALNGGRRRRDEARYLFGR